jgi:hypothetical protein
VAHRTARLNVFDRQLLVTRIELDRWPPAKAAEAGNRGQRRADRVADGRRPDLRVPTLHPPAGARQRTAPVPEGVEVALRLVHGVITPAGMVIATYEPVRERT